MKRALLAVMVMTAGGAAAFDKPIIQTPTCTHNNFRILEAVKELMATEAPGQVH